MIGPAVPESRPARYAEQAAVIVDHWRARGNRSHDPFDGLETAWVRNPTRLPRSLRLALVQLHKRSPVNLRSVFRVPPTRNAYGEGLLASTALRLWRRGLGERYLDAAHDSLAWLRSVRIRGGWAYPFDVQTRTFFYPKTTPNVVCTAFAARAFRDAAAMTGETGHAEVAVEAARFCLDELLTGEPDRPWFGYLPGDRELIHNANLLAARLCAEAAAADDGLLEAARAATRTTLGDQHPDGSFAYGVGPRLAWIDGHHTGFVVECLAHLSAAGVGEAGAALDSAAGFYRDRLFGRGGLPRPAPGRDHPVDAIAAAQGIETFAVLGQTAFAETIAGWANARLRGRRGTYAFQRGRAHTKRVPYARWSDAPMAVALATLADHLES